MSRSKRTSIDRTRPVHAFRLDDDDLFDLPFDDDEPVPVDGCFDDVSRVTLDAVIRGHRWQLVAVAHHHLRGRRADAEDVVQDVCLEAVDGQLALPADAEGMLDELRREVAARCRGSR